MPAYVRTTFKLVAVDAADEAEVTHVCLCRPLANSITHHSVIIIIF